MHVCQDPSIRSQHTELPPASGTDLLLYAGKCVMHEPKTGRFQSNHELHRGGRPSARVRGVGVSAPPCGPNSGHSGRPAS